jgi:hypothetical protein
MGDKLSDLPITENAPVPKSDLEMVDALFKNRTQTNKVAYEFKDSIIGGILFLVLSSSPIDKAIRGAGCHSEVGVLVVKFLMFIILFFIVKNSVK